MSTKPAQPQVFASLAGAGRVWAIGAVRGEAGRLATLHEELRERLEVGDRLVYLGNFLGVGPDVPGTVNDMLRFRWELLATPGFCVSSIVYLRGAQEEMWRRFLELQFARNPGEVLDWMLGQGVAATLLGYGADPEAARRVCRDGPLGITRFTSAVRAAVHARPGHGELMIALRRAAYVPEGGLLLVAAGVDPTRPLSEQGDTLWWGSGYFATISEPFDRFTRVVRGDDRGRRGPGMGEHTATLDGGCGYGGALHAACFTPDGRPVDWIQV